MIEMCFIADRIRSKSAHYTVTTDHSVPQEYGGPYPYKDSCQFSLYNQNQKKVAI